MSRPIVFLDTETDQLHPFYRRPWEVAFIRRDSSGIETDRQRFFINLGDLSKSSRDSLEKGGFWERHPDIAPAATGKIYTAAFAADLIRRMTHGATIVGAVPSFDTDTLSRVLYAHNLHPTWEHRLICVESMTAGRLGRLVGGLRDCADALGVRHNDLQLHTAMGDAILAMRIYDELVQPTEETEELL